MAFQSYMFKEDEKREYTLTIWPFIGKKYFPKGGMVDIENDIRLFMYGNGPEMEPCDEYQFIFDYKGTAMNIEITEKTKKDGFYYTIDIIEGKDVLDDNEFLPFLREAILFWANKKWNRFGKHDPDSFLHIEF